MHRAALFLSVLGTVHSAQGLARASRVASLSRRDASRALALGGGLLVCPPAVWAGASTDLRTDRVVAMNKYRGRVEAGRDYWKSELPKFISSGDWAAIRETLSVKPDPKDKRGKRKLEGALLAMQRPMDLWASSFSRGAQRSEETIALLEASDAFKAAAAQLDEATAATVKSGGLFGILGGTKELSQGEREKKAKDAYSKGSKALSAYIKEMNEELKTMGVDPMSNI